MSDLKKKLNIWQNFKIQGIILSDSYPNTEWVSSKTHQTI